MAIQVESRGQIQDFLDVLRRRKWQVILPAAFLITIGTSFAVLVPKKYVIKTQVELRPVSFSVSSKEGSNAPFQIKAASRVRKVVQELAKSTERGSTYLALKPEEQTEFIEAIQKNIKVTTAKDPTKDTGANFLTIEYADVDDVWGVTFLRALRQDWIQDVLERDRNKILDEEKKLQDHAASLEKQRAQESKELTELKTRHGISPTQPIPSAAAPRNEDPVYTRLQKDKDLRTETERELIQLQVQIDELEKQYDDMPEKLKEEQVVAGSNYAEELKQIELEYLAVEKEKQKYRPAHPKYTAAVKRSRELEERREQLSRLIKRDEVQTTASANPARLELRSKIDGLKIEAAQLKAAVAQMTEDINRDERDFTRLQDVYSEIILRSEKIERLVDAQKQATLQHQNKVVDGKVLASPLANPFEITQDVQAPPKATEPNPWLIIAFSVIAGLAVGVGTAVGLEYSKNCFRSVGDINRVMVVPVLGSIDTIVTRREARVSGARRVLIGVTSAASLGALIFLTWAYSMNPELLSHGVREKIRMFRALFA